MQPIDDERLTAYLDDELDELGRVRFEAELRDDAELRDALQALRDSREFMRQAGPLAAPAGLYDKIMDKVDEDVVVSDRSAWWRRPMGVPIEGLAVAAVAVLVLLSALPRASLSDAEELEVQPAVRLEGAGEDAVPMYAVPAGLMVRLPEDGGLELLERVAADVHGTRRHSDHDDIYPAPTVYSYAAPS